MATDLLRALIATEVRTETRLVTAQCFKMGDKLIWENPSPSFAVA